MGRLLISTENKLDGPWLLGKEELEELDKLICVINDKLTEAYQIEEEKNDAENKKNGIITYFNSSIRNKNHGVPQVELISSEDKKLVDSSIKGVLKDKNLSEFSPKELYIKIEYGHPENEFKMSVISGIDGHIEYKLKCFDEGILDDTKYELDKWFDKFKPKKIVQIWSGLYPLIMIVGILTLLIMLSTLWDTPENFSSQLTKDAHALIERGVNKDNLNEAVELILKLQSDYKPKGFKSEDVLNLKSVRTFVIALLAFIILVFCPRTVIGLGKKAYKVKFYRFWLWMTVTFIPSSFFLPKLIELIQKNIL